MTIIDASAILGLILSEERATPVVAYLGDAAIAAPNYAEVIGKLADAGMPSEVAAMLMDRLRLQVIDFDARHAVIAGELKPRTAHLGLSLGDRACLATGLVDGDRIVTLDRIWADVDLEVPIVVLT